MPAPLVLGGLAAGTLGALLGRVLAWVIGGVVFRLISSFGVGVVVFYGLSELLEAAMQQIMLMTASLPTVMAQLFSVLNIDDAIVIVFSALSIRLSLKTFGLGGVGAVLVKGSSTGPG